jgi:hypothetical protein
MDVRATEMTLQLRQRLLAARMQACLIFPADRLLDEACSFEQSGANIAGISDAPIVVLQNTGGGVWQPSTPRSWRPHSESHAVNWRLLSSLRLPT